MRYLLFLLVAISYYQSCFSQVVSDIITIEGMVADSATFKALPYVNILIRNTGRGTQTDAQGSFRMQASRTDTLILSFVGYRTRYVALYDWEPGIILMSEVSFVLQSVTVEGKRMERSYYEDLFHDQNALLEKQNKKLPFYYSKQKKEGIRVDRLENENNRVKIYVEVVVNNSELKAMIMKKHSLRETEYYNLLTKFNEQNHSVMYYLTASELLTLIYKFYERNAGR